MRMTLEIYQERIDEIELYFNALKELYRHNLENRSIHFIMTIF